MENCKSKGELPYSGQTVKYFVLESGTVLIDPALTSRETRLFMDGEVERSGYVIADPALAKLILEKLEFDNNLLKMLKAK